MKLEMNILKLKTRGITSLKTEVSTGNHPELGEYTIFRVTNLGSIYVMHFHRDRTNYEISYSILDFLGECFDAVKKDREKERKK